MDTTKCRLENRRRLSAATVRYFDELEAAAASEENAIAQELASAASEIDFDGEP